jgi:hypothetical protein
MKMVETRRSAMIRVVKEIMLNVVASVYGVRSRQMFDLLLGYSPGGIADAYVIALFGAVTDIHEAGEKAKAAAYLNLPHDAASIDAYAAVCRTMDLVLDNLISQVVGIASATRRVSVEDDPASHVKYVSHQIDVWLNCLSESALNEEMTAQFIRRLGVTL